jgi:hypothetical protein
MRPRTCGKTFSRMTLDGALVVVCVGVLTLPVLAARSSGKVVIRENVSPAHRDELLGKLRLITGLTKLGFDDHGALQLGSEVVAGGSRSARDLLDRAVSGKHVIVLEDASSRVDVVFCRVVSGRWISEGVSKPPAYVVLIDFNDFHQVTGDKQARAAFDVGWGVLHEVDHVVNDSRDHSLESSAGECEDHINKMRREIGLPIRATYFFTLLPIKGDPNLLSRFVRLGFERENTPAHKAKRYWLVWDAAVVGGLASNDQTISLLGPK